MQPGRELESENSVNIQTGSNKAGRVKLKRAPQNDSYRSTRTGVTYLERPVTMSSDSDSEESGEISAPIMNPEEFREPIEEHDAKMNEALYESFENFEEPSRSMARKRTRDFRMIGKKDKTLSFCKTNTGCHCFSAFCCNTSCEKSELSVYGLGVSLYFKYLKWLLITFLIQFLITLPQLLTNISVTTPQENDVWIILESTTLAAKALSNQTLTNNSTGTPGKNNHQMYVWTDIAAMLFWTLALQYLRYFQEAETKKETDDFETIDEYTVQIRNIPKNSTEDSIRFFLQENSLGDIADVVIAENNGKLIRLWIKRGKSLKRLWTIAGKMQTLKKKLRNRISSIQSESKKITIHSKLEKCEKDFHNEQKNYEKITKHKDKLQERTENKSIYAYVTFNKQRDYRKCLDMYGKSKTCSSCLHSRSQPFQYVTVAPAPNPSNILWENLEHRMCSRMSRKGMTFVFTLVAFAISVTISYIGYKAQDDFFESSCDLNQTAYELETTSLLNITQSALDCFCGSYSYGQAVNAIFDQTDTCHSYWEIRSPTFAYSVLVSLGISGVNILLVLLLQTFSVWEKHHSIIDKELSIVWRLSIALIVNTGILVSVVNANIDWLQEAFSFVGGGTFYDFTPSWYSNVGTQIMLIMTINILSPHLFNLLYAMYFFLRRCRTTKLSQLKLDERYIGPSFLLSHRLAQLIMTVYVTMIYSSGMPLLYLIAAISFGVYIVVDKFLVLKFYRVPPRYDARLLLFSTSILEWTPAIHLAFSIWQYSAPGVFNETPIVYMASNSTSPRLSNTRFSQWAGSLAQGDISNRILTNSILPLVISCAALLLGTFMLFMLRLVPTIPAFICKTISCGYIEWFSPEKYFKYNLSESKKRKRLLGIQSYLILQNPRYSRAFGVGDRISGHYRKLQDLADMPLDQLPRLKPNRQSISAHTVKQLKHMEQLKFKV